MLQKGFIQTDISLSIEINWKTKLLNYCVPKFLKSSILYFSFLAFTMYPYKERQQGIDGLKVCELEFIFALTELYNIPQPIVESSLIHPSVYF